MEKKDLARIRLWLFDMDGTLYLGEQLFPFTKALLAAIRAKGGRYLYLTNNSSKSVPDYVRKMERLGIEASEGDFLTSAQVTAWYLHRHHEGKRLYVCGTASLQAELAAEGFPIANDEPDRAECVVMGYDTELTYQKLLDVSRLLTERPDLPYIATNPDLVCPMPNDEVLPDCGSICALLTAATGRKPLYIGKPDRRMVDVISEQTGVPNGKIACVGDRLYTDVAVGVNAGAVSVLVLSGETTEDMLSRSEIRPDYVFPSVKELGDQLKAAD